MPLLRYTLRKILCYRLVVEAKKPNPERLRLRHNHTWENGRRYHGYKSEFSFPDDYETKAGIVWRDLTASKPFVAPLDLPLKKRIPKYFINDGIYAKAREAFHLMHGEALDRLLKDWGGFCVDVFRHLVPWGWAEIREHDLKFCPREGKEKEMEGKWDATKQCEYHRHLIYHIEGCSLRLFTKTLGWSKEDTDDLLKRVLQELDQEDLQLYSLFIWSLGGSRQTLQGKFGGC
ncbi:hypothetical protein BDW66DRAFT_165412 [Aspergillus desertorum]